MTTVFLAVKPATAENFAPFGDLITAGVPTFGCPSFDWFERLAVLDGQSAEFGVVTAKDDGSREQATLERHRNTAEIIVPLERPAIVALATGEADKPADFAAFELPVGALAVVNAGVWHQAPKTFGENASSLIVYKTGTGANDKEQITLAERGLKVFIEEGSKL